MTLLNRLSHRADASAEDGQALVEYALIVGTVAILALGGLQLIGTHVNTLLSGVVGAFGGV